MSQSVLVVFGVLTGLAEFLIAAVGEQRALGFGVFLVGYVVSATGAV